MDMNLVLATLGWAGLFLVILVAVIALVVFVAFRVHIVGRAVVREGYYVAFTMQGGFVYGAMQFDGYHLETNGVVVRDGFHLKSNGSIVQDSVTKPPNVPLGQNWHGNGRWIWRWGGWVFYVALFVEPAKYSDYNDPKDRFGGNIYVRLGDVAFKPHTSLAETTEKDKAGNATGQHVGVNVSFTSKGRVVRPQYFLWHSPYDVVKEAVEDRQDGVLRALIYDGSVDDIQAVKGNGANLWEKLGILNLLEAFDEAKNDWGLEVVKNSIVVKRVDFDADYQKAMKSESEQGLLAKGTRVRLFSPIEEQADVWVASQVISTPLANESAEKTAVRVAQMVAEKKAELVANGKYAEELNRLTVLQLADGGHLKKEQVEAIGFGADVLAIAEALGRRK